MQNTTLKDEIERIKLSHRNKLLIPNPAIVDKNDRFGIKEKRGN